MVLCIVDLPHNFNPPPSSSLFKLNCFCADRMWLKFRAYPNLKYNCETCSLYSSEILVKRLHFFLSFAFFAFKNEQKGLLSTGDSYWLVQGSSLVVISGEGHSQSSNDLCLIVNGCNRLVLPHRPIIADKVKKVRPLMFLFE